ncbi:HD domain-containing protein [Texcoconibacillus texcoconensis]|uniref:HD/PDEase domain-containing protein n=1 Tax=Texcoconibacillus texcoconensis TaxID=1095777 RepID=A0A840QSK9_9BACI|nr:uncharacterized protein [Texcoconibacillus texcoconensis]
MHQQTIRNAEEKVQRFFANDATGHDWYHTDRVRKVAIEIANHEGADASICELAALLHDVADEKFHESKENGEKYVREWLMTCGDREVNVEKVMNIITKLSFRGGGGQAPSCLEGKIVQDADRLDAIGAIGIARCFMFAGAKGDAMYDPSISPREHMTATSYRQEKSSAINHFYEKLLKLKNRMNTKTGEEIAKTRHQRLETFLDAFFQEWSGK